MLDPRALETGTLILAHPTNIRVPVSNARRSKQPKDYNIDFMNNIMYPQYYNYIWNRFQVVFYKGNRCGCEI